MLRPVRDIPYMNSLRTLELPKEDISYEFTTDSWIEQELWVVQDAMWDVFEENIKNDW